MRMGVSSAARSENHVWRDFSSDFLGNLLDVHISTEILSTKLTYFKKMEVFRRHHTFNDPINFIDPRGTDADTYIQFPFPHGVIRVDDPSSSTGSTYFDFYPPNGGGYYTPTQGEVGSGAAYSGILIPRNHYPLTPQQDQELLNRARQLQRDAQNGKYPYSTFGPGGKNCYGFMNDVCGNTCQ